MPEQNILMEMNNNMKQSTTPPTTASSVHVKAPRRILHFSDGTLEEYSTDDETDATKNHSQKQIDLVSFLVFLLCSFKIRHMTDVSLKLLDCVTQLNKIMCFLFVYRLFQKKLDWRDWLVYQALHGGNCVLAACDFVGEKLAAALGITTPKYSFEIEQFKKIQKEREKSHEEEKSVGGWMQQTYDDKNIDGNQQCIITQEKVQRF